MKTINKQLIDSVYKESISITHRHALSVINTLILNEQTLFNKKVIKILDAGCGNGKLLYFLHKFLPLFNQDKEFVICGYDVIDHGVQVEGYVEKTFSFLHERDNSINWNERIKMINADDSWPFENNLFDIIVSNQVLEHVWDHDHFFKEHTRVMDEKAFAIHIFPVKEVILDGHIFLPNVHKFNNWDAIYKRVKFYSRIGLGKIYNREKDIYNNDLDYFSKVWADKIYHFCNYQTYNELTKAVKKNHLNLTTQFTFDFYKRKIKEIFGVKPNLIYYKRPSSKLIFFFLKRISGVSFVLYKGEYSKY